MKHVLPFQIFALRNRKGFVLVLGILVVGAVGLAVSTSLILLGLGSSRSSFSLEQSNQAKALANACGESALQKIRDEIAFSGSGSLAMGQANCTYAVEVLGGQNRKITVLGFAGSSVRKIQIMVSRVSPRVRVASWQEVADF